MKRAFCLIVLAALRLAAQQTSANPPAQVFGQVTGRVICHDTGQPARFAGVQLVSEDSAKSPMFDPSAMGKNPDFGKVMAQAMKMVMKGSNLSAVTNLDGSYSLDKVPPGTYYVIAQFAGYRSPLSGISQADRMVANDTTLKAVESQAEKIVVQPGQTNNVNLELERGASLTGTITYDDGSPAPGVTPVLMVVDKDGKWKELGPSGLLPVSTDDRGHFRFYGLLPGKYAVKASLPVVQTLSGVGAGSISVHMNPSDALVVYSGNVLREKEIKPIELTDGQDLDGIEVVFPINGLHSISGSVVAKSDNHAVNSGTLELDYSDTKAAVRTAMINQDGTFRINYVPNGMYALKVSSAADMAYSGGDAGGGAPNLMQMMNGKELHTYGSVTMPVTINDDDANGITLQVPEAGGAQSGGAGNP
jgi:hypothetical protein